MKLRALIIILGLACLGGYVTTAWDTSGTTSSSPPLPQTSDVPFEAAALAGAWEGLRPDDLPVRLVVEEIRGNWATVRYSWGDQPEGRFHRGWERVRALVLPGGKLFWHRPGGFTFQLSDDWTTLVGKREQGGATATSLMRRVPAGITMSTLYAAIAPVRQKEGNAMSNAVLSMIGWGLFYWILCLYVFWAFAERTFFAGSDPERWDPHAHADQAGLTWDDHGATPHLPYVSTLGRPA